MYAAVATALGTMLVDLDDEQVIDGAAQDPPAPADAGVSLPRLVAAARSGSTVVAVVDRKPPLLVSYDAGTTWREAGSGLPPGRAVDVSRESPDTVLFAGESRLYVSTDGGRFWRALSVELPGITAVALAED